MAEGVLSARVEPLCGFTDARDAPFVFHNGAVGVSGVCGELDRQRWLAGELIRGERESGRVDCDRHAGAVRLPADAPTELKGLDEVLIGARRREAGVDVLVVPQVAGGAR